VGEPSLPRRNLSRLKAAWIGGSPVMQATYDRYLAALGLRHLLSTYGMTENTISTTFNRLDDPRSICSENRAPVLGDTEVRVVDPATGKALPVGEVGEVWCRGETVMMGYYKNPAATRETITAQGWLKTGDLGRFDESGFLSITGRLREMYKSGGTNVYPAEIEQHLVRHPAVKQVAVIGVPDERLGEVGCAFVELNEGGAFDAEQMRSHCKGVLADYKIPRHLEIVAALPRTTTGKIQKSALKRS
jgi:fatty-acyl-CoA synthase